MAVAVMVMAFLAGATAAGCGGTGSTVTLADWNGTDGMTADAGIAAVPDRVTEADDREVLGESAPIDTALDLGLEEQVGACEGPGCPGAQCKSNSDCGSGFCVAHLGEQVCTEECTEECPDGFQCLQYGRTDLTYVCVSSFPFLCMPCDADEDCSLGGALQARCLLAGPDGAFCGGSCGPDMACPDGFECKSATGLDGEPLEGECVKSDELCGCTGLAVANAAQTACYVENDEGKCAGKRSCTELGLSDCDAQTPLAEACNGADDDCDGEVDEPKLSDGKYLELCDDASDCTQDTCDGVAGCSHKPLDGGECVDGDPCTAGDHCSAGTCLGLPVVCDDGDPCTDDSCDGAGGCKSENNVADCDDGDPCTVKDTCDGGVCSGFSVDCSCMSDADCVAFDDGDLCTGTLVCDKSSLPYKCIVKEGSEVQCPEPPEGADAMCLASACVPETGDCELVPAHEGFACFDGDVCTVGDKCGAGACTAGDAMECDDGNGCTDDSCDPASGCVHSSNAAECDDGNACTAGDHCAQGSCAFDSLVDCTDTNPCTTDACDGKTGCVYNLNALSCDDGSACTVGDACKLGVCQPGVTVSCDDGNPCSDDSCVPASGCVHKANQAPCDDGNECTTGDHCQSKQCVFDAALGCGDGNVCTDDSCDPAAGCEHKLNAAPCDDGDVCTTGDKCAAGTCSSTGDLACNDSNPCTDDSCAPTTGCIFEPNAAPCDDGDVCTQTDKCVAGKCSGSNEVGCDDGESCTEDLCHPAKGCIHMPLAGPCEDGNACTLGDECDDGACAPGVVNSCNDGVSCTLDTCEAETGCIHFPDHGKCDDSKPCTTDSCDLQAGCVHVPQAPCCGNGIVEPPEECDDGNALSFDGCSAACVIEPIPKCTSPGKLVAQNPANNMIVCEDPAHSTCEQDFENLCPVGWHLCSHTEFNARNDGWDYSVSEPRRALGVIYCRMGGGAGHFTVPDAGKSSGNLGQDETHNCYFGSSRPACPAGYGCNETGAVALCCSKNPKCGNGAVDGPEEVCDDGNWNQDDACLNNCTKRLPGGGGTNCGG